MQYDQDTAIKIVQRFGLDAGALKNWKSRGIPDKYFDDQGNLKNPEHLKPATKQELARFKRIIEQSGINQSGFAALTAQRIADIMRNKGVLSAQEYTAFKIEITQIRNSLRNIQQAKTAAAIEHEAKKVVNDPRLHWNLIFTRDTVDYLKRNFDVEITELHQFQLDAALFYQSITI